MCIRDRLNTGLFVVDLQIIITLLPVINIGPCIFYECWFLVLSIHYLHSSWFVSFPLLLLFFFWLIVVHHRCSPGSVSYTHLDVYKRQAILLFLLLGWIFSIIYPVSYTHLDVYKRQVYLCPVFSWLLLVLTFGNSPNSVWPSSVFWLGASINWFLFFLSSLISLAYPSTIRSHFSWSVSYTHLDVYKRQQ